MAAKKQTQGMKIIAIPVSWMVYSLPDNIFEIMGATVQQPPLIVAEALVDSGMGVRLRKIETGIEVEDVDEEALGAGPWYNSEHEK
jgi:hypothetical protein